MSNDTIKDIINDVRDLAATHQDPMTRLALEGIANRLQALFGKHGEQENQEIAGNDDEGGGATQTAKRNWLELPRGIVLKRFVNTRRETTLVGQYRNEHANGGDNPRRVYQIKVTPIYPGAEVGTEDSKAFTVVVTEDGKHLFTIHTRRGRSIAERLGIKALKAWLNYMVGDIRRGKEAKKRRRKQNKANRRARKAALTGNGEREPLTTNH